MWLFFSLREKKSAPFFSKKRRGDFIPPFSETHRKRDTGKRRRSRPRSWRGEVESRGRPRFEAANGCCCVGKSRPLGRQSAPPPICRPSKGPWQSEKKDEGWQASQQQACRPPAIDRGGGGRVNEPAPCSARKRGEELVMRIKKTKSFSLSLYSPSHAFLQKPVVLGVVDGEASHSQIPLPVFQAGCVAQSRDGVLAGLNKV